MKGLVRTLFVGLAGGVKLAARGIWLALNLLAVVLWFTGRYLILGLRWTIVVAAPVLGRGIRGAARRAWPWIVFTVAAIGLGLTRAGTWVKETLRRWLPQR